MADDKEEVDAHDPHYEPIIQLPDLPVDVTNMEENEDEILKLRAKLFRFDTSESAGEWKERGTGDVKLLKHKETQRVRVVMRRDKTHKMCANHYITSHMNLIASSGSDRAWVWHTAADLVDTEAKEERLAIRFANAENAQKFKLHFDEAKEVDADNKENGNASTSADEDENEKDVETSKETTLESGAGDKVEAVEKVCESKEEKSDGADAEADDVAEKLGDIKLADSDDKAEDKENDVPKAEGAAEAE